MSGSPTLALLKGSIPNQSAIVHDAEGNAAEDMLPPMGDLGEWSMPAAKKAKKITKDKNSLIVPTTTSSGEVLGPDLLATTAHEIENLTETEANAMIGDLTDTSDFNAFKLGGVLARVNANNWFGEFEDFKSYVQGKHGFALRKAFYLVSIYESVIELGLTWADLKPVGWSKLKELVGVINQENAQDWLTKAAQDGMTVMKLHALVQAAKGEAQPQIEGESTKTINKTFKLHQDQNETITAALDKAMKVANTDVPSVALEYMALDYLGNSEVVASAEGQIDQHPKVDLNMDVTVNDASTEWFKAYMVKLGWEGTLGVFEENFPNLNLTVEAPAA